MPAMPILTLTPDEAKRALDGILSLHGEPYIELGFDQAVLVALDRRLASRHREVPRDAWPEIEHWINEMPYLITQLTPSAGSQARRPSSCGGSSRPTASG